MQATLEFHGIRPRSGPYLRVDVACSDDVRRSAEVALQACPLCRRRYFLLTPDGRPWEGPCPCCLDPLPLPEAARR